MKKKIYITVESDSKEKETVLSDALNVLETVEGVDYAKGHVGLTGKPQERRYEVESKMRASVARQEHEKALREERNG